MNHEVMPILYEMAMAIGGEISLEPLLTRALQRLLYYTSFPAGFICLDLPAVTEDAEENITATLHAAVGDYKLTKLVGCELSLPKSLLLGPATKADDQSALFASLPTTQPNYRAFLRLPIGKVGVAVLMAPKMPESKLPLTLMFEPIMAFLARSIVLCRHYDDHREQLQIDRQEAIARAEFLTLHDALTHLPNRGLLFDRIHQAMALGSRNGQYGALLTLNIDHFKRMNDVYGYEVCDQILIDTARRLQASVREGDTVARVGNDEFMLLLWPLPTAQHQAAVAAKQIAQNIQAQLGQPYQSNGSTFSINFNIGVSLFRAHLDTLENLLKHAEASVQQAKMAGSNNIRFFDSDIQQQMMLRLEMENDIRSALTQQAFRLHYQLQVDDRESVIGAEVLLRWQHPKRGFVSPAVFVPVAEQIGAIIEIGYWVLQQACKQLRNWQQDPQMRRMQLAVNVSAVQFHRDDFVDTVSRLLDDYGDIVALLKFELTESVVLEGEDAVVEKIRALKKLGIRFSLDDFGTGYSSLAYLKRLPLNQLKIDQSFVRDIGHDANAAIIAQTIVGMANNLGLNVIAEGVETQQQLDLLKQYGCNAYQGYLFAKPLPIDEFEALIGRYSQAG